MRQATNREKAAKIAEKDPFGPVDEQLDKSAASEEANAATMAQVFCQLASARRWNPYPSSGKTGVQTMYLYTKYSVWISVRKVDDLSVFRAEGKSLQ